MDGAKIAIPSYSPEHVIEGKRELRDTEEVISFLFLHLYNEGIGLGLL